MAEQVIDVPVYDIYEDESFNCRGNIAPIDVVDLAKDIQQNGLIEPIILRPLDEHAARVLGRKYSIVAGYRRYKAHVINKAETVPSIIRNMTEVEARGLNIRENLFRKNLNIVQEARSIEYFRMNGFNEYEVSNLIGQSRGWVQTRYMLLSLPKEIQEVAESGILTQTHVRELYRMKKPELQFAAVKQIKETIERAEGKKVKVEIEKPKNPDQKRQRSKVEILEMIQRIARIRGYNFTTRALAWASGEITDGEFDKDIQKFEEQCSV